jgi:hypothetical protein
MHSVMILKLSSLNLPRCLGTSIGLHPILFRQLFFLIGLLWQLKIVVGMILSHPTDERIELVPGSIR